MTLDTLVEGYQRLCECMNGKKKKKKKKKQGKKKKKLRSLILKLGVSRIPL